VQGNRIFDDLYDANIRSIFWFKPVLMQVYSFITLADMKLAFRFNSDKPRRQTVPLLALKIFV